MKKKVYCVVIVGPIGCGKTTHVQILSGTFILPNYDSSVGLRTLAEYNTFLEPVIRTGMTGGVPISDDIVLFACEKSLKALPKKSFFATGVPRKVGQGPRFRKVAMDVMGVTDFIVVNLELPIRTAIARLALRAEIESRPDDKDPAAIKRRIDLFNEENDAILEEFRQSGARVVNAHCHKDPHVTVDRIIKAIGHPFVDQFIHHRKRGPRLKAIAAA